MTAHRPKTLVRALAGFVVLGVVLTPACWFRRRRRRTRRRSSARSAPPNVFYPVGTKRVKDLANGTKRRPGTDIQTACNAAVRAAHPGIVQVLPATPRASGSGSSPAATAGSGRCYAHLGSVSVTDGQIVQSGQAPRAASARSRGPVLHALLRDHPQRQAPLNPPPGSTTGWARRRRCPTCSTPRASTWPSFNILGASHTKSSTSTRPTPPG